MLLQQIVNVFDRELDRLEQLRGIVASLEGTTELLLAEAAQSAGALAREALAVPEPAAEAAPEGKPGKRTSTRTVASSGTGRMRRPRAAKTTSDKAAAAAARRADALSGTIPAGPVMISPGALAKERQTRSRGQEDKAPETPVGTLGAMIKAMELHTAG